MNKVPTLLQHKLLRDVLLTTPTKDKYQKVSWSLCKADWLEFLAAGGEWLGMSGADLGPIHADRVKKVLELRELRPGEKGQPEYWTLYRGDFTSEESVL